MTGHGPAGSAGVGVRPAEAGPVGLGPFALANHLRTICTVPVTAGEHATDPALWARVLAGWRDVPLRRPDGPPSAELAGITGMVRREDQADALLGAVALARWPQADEGVYALVNTLDGGRFVTVRIFAAQLTELQELAAAVTQAMLREPVLSFPPETRVALAITVEGVRRDLTSGRVRPGRGGVLGAFYDANKYVVNVTLAVLAGTLAVVFLVTPAAPYSPLGKAYGLAERVLSAVLLNALLLGSQFLYFLRHRPVIEWQRAART